MKKETNHLSKFWKTTLLVGVIGLLLSINLVYAYSLRESSRTIDSSNQCYVPPEQTVVRWKTAIWMYCKIPVAGMCAWPISQGHVTYKVTVKNGIPLRSEGGSVIAAANGKMQKHWETFDANSWKALYTNYLHEYELLDYEPIASNEYVVMVETRYRLFNDVESTIGICVQK